MKIYYQEGSNTIRTSTNCLVAVKTKDYWILDIDKSVDIDIATKLFQRWHSLHTYASPEKLASALDEAISKRLYIQVGTRKVPVYWNGKLNELGIESALNSSGLLGKRYEKFSCQHDIQSNSVRYWANDCFIDSQLIIFE